MSASSKKKIRNEAAAAKLTEKQLAEQKEQQKVKGYTIAFVLVLAVLLAVAIWAGVSKTISGSGLHERNTTALTVGDHTLSNAELNYYFIDAVNNFYSQNGSMAALYGLDVSKPLNQQFIDEESGYTWADNFVEAAESNARAIIALADEAEKNGFTLTAEQQEQVDTLEYNLQSYATLSGLSSADDYLKAYYGKGARVDTFKEYYKRNILASSYESFYVDSLSYSDDQIRAKEQENFDLYSSYSYNQYYLSTSKFLTGGTQDESGSTVYSDEERAAAEKAAEEAAKTLTADTITSVEALDAAIAALSVNADTSASSTAYNNQRYNSINSVYSDWVTDASRKEGDLTYVASTSTSTDENGAETTKVNGYYVVYYIGSTDNKIPTINVRHILSSFEGGSQDQYGNTTYSDAEKMLSQAAAEGWLNEWKSGDATEDSFAALATANTTDPGSAANGGLYENVYPGQMVTAFNDWCFAEGRKPGDTGVVETEYGYHVMYFVGKSDMTYRDYLISNDLRNDDYNDWYTALVDAIPMTEGNTAYLNTGLVLNNN